MPDHIANHVEKMRRQAASQRKAHPNSSMYHGVMAGAAYLERLNKEVKLLRKQVESIRKIVKGWK